MTFNINICKKLEERGLVSKTGEYYQNYWHTAYGWERVKEGFVLLEGIYEESHSDCDNQSKLPKDAEEYPSYNLESILERENSITLWGDDKLPSYGSLPTKDILIFPKVNKDGTWSVSDIRMWQYQSHLILSIFQTEGFSALEQYLEKELRTV